MQKVGPKMLDQEGKEVPGNRGYKYFGAAKDLPGVRELFEQERKHFISFVSWFLLKSLRDMFSNFYWKSHSVYVIEFLHICVSV